MRATILAACYYSGGLIFRIMRMDFFWTNLFLALEKHFFSFGSFSAWWHQGCVLDIGHLSKYQIYRFYRVGKFYRQLSTLSGGHFWVDFWLNASVFSLSTKSYARSRTRLAYKKRKVARLRMDRWSR